MVNKAHVGTSITSQSQKEEKTFPTFIVEALTETHELYCLGRYISELPLLTGQKVGLIEISLV